MNPLAPRQHDLFIELCSLWMKTGRPPTIRELNLEMGYRSTNASRDGLEGMLRKGYVSRGRLARDTVPTDRGWSEWARIMSERMSTTITGDEARVLTLLLAALRDMGPERGLDAVRGVLAHLTIARGTLDRTPGRRG